MIFFQQYIAYIEPPNQVIEQSFLPVIQCYSSVSSSTSNGLNENGFHYKSITPSSSTLRTAMYCQTESEYLNSCNINNCTVTI
jgi:hypothetical protein